MICLNSRQRWLRRLPIAFAIMSVVFVGCQSGSDGANSGSDVRTDKGDTMVDDTDVSSQDAMTETCTATESICPSGRWCNTMSTSCEECPGDDLTCSDFSGEKSDVRPGQNAVTLVFDAGVVDIDSIEVSATATFSGGGTMVQPVNPMSTTVENPTTVEIKFGDSDADQLELTGVVITDACGVDHELNIAVDWEPSTSQASDFSCAPPLR